MPDWLITTISHGGPAAITVVVLWIYIRERAERIAANQAILALTREVITASQQMVLAVNTNTHATSGLSDRVSTVADKLDAILLRRGKP